MRNKDIKLKNNFTFIIVAMVLFVVSLCGCDPTKETVRNTEDQNELAQIATKAKNIEVCEAAVEKLTDQDLLAKVAVEGKTMWAREAAVKKLTDKALLAKVAIESEEKNICKEALEKLTDEAVLAKIAIESEYKNTCKEALDKLTDQALLAKVAVEGKDANIREKSVVTLIEILASNVNRESNEGVDIYPGILQMVPAFSTLPKEHRTRLARSVFPALDELCNSQEIAEQLGEISWIQVGWKERSQLYRTKFSYTGGETMRGECFFCSIKFEKRSYPILCNWETVFHNTVYGHANYFNSADIDYQSFLIQMMDQVRQNSHSFLKEYAIKGKDSSVRQAAVEKLNDQASLAEVAVEGQESSVRQTAVIKLTDQALLAKVAVESEYSSVSKAAVEKLNDQALLAKVAVEGKTVWAHEAAIKKLTDEDLLAKIAVESKYYNIRLLAKKRMAMLDER